jgi:hypothetical protein
MIYIIYIDDNPFLMLTPDFSRAIYRILPTEVDLLFNRRAINPK